MKVVAADIYTGRGRNLFRGLCEFSPRRPRNPAFPRVAHYRVRAYRCMINEIMKLGVSGSSCFELRVINRRKRDKVFVTATPFLISP